MEKGEDKALEEIKERNDSFVEANEISDLWTFIDEYILKAQDIAIKFEITEEESMLYKISEE